jgi:sulfurtransferase TusA-like protein
MSQVFDKLLDARGLNCPMPLVNARKEIGKLELGQVLKVVATVGEQFHIFCDLGPAHRGSIADFQEIVSLGKRVFSSQLAACDIASAISSCAALGNMVIWSMKGSVHAAFRSTYQSPACHSGAAANIRAIFPPSGLISITPGMLTFSRSRLFTSAWEIDDHCH